MDEGGRFAHAALAHYQRLPAAVGPIVDLVVDRCARHSLIVLAAARPGQLPNWAARDDVDRIRLAGLDQPDTASGIGRIEPITVRRSRCPRQDSQPLVVPERVGAHTEQAGELP